MPIPIHSNLLKNDFPPNIMHVKYIHVVRIRFHNGKRITISMIYCESTCVRWMKMSNEYVF